MRKRVLGELAAEGQADGEVVGDAGGRAGEVRVLGQQRLGHHDARLGQRERGVEAVEPGRALVAADAGVAALVDLGEVQLVQRVLEFLAQGRGRGEVIFGPLLGVLRQFLQIECLVISQLIAQPA